MTLHIVFGFTDVCDLNLYEKINQNNNLIGMGTHYSSGIL